MDDQYETLEEQVMRKMVELKNDPIAWIEYFTNTNEGVVDRADLPVLHPGQKKWIENSVQKVNSLSAANRWGKSVVTAKKHIFKCLTKEGVEIEDSKAWIREDYKTLNCAPTSDLSDKIWNIVDAIMRQPKLSWAVKNVARFPNKVMTFYNGAQFCCETTANKARAILGEKFRFASFDECDFEMHFTYVVRQVLMQRLLDYNGSLDLVSTPDGKGHFFREFRKADPELPTERRSKMHYSQYGAIWDNPYIDRKAIDDLKAVTPRRLWAQHLEGKFIDSESAVFSAGQIDRLIDAELPFVQEPKPGHRYVGAYDLARKEDYNAGFVLDITEKPFTVVYIFHEAFTPWSMIKNEIRRTEKHYRADMVIDSSGLGDVILDDLDDVVDGFTFTEKSKSNLLLNLQLALDYKRDIDENGVDRNPEFGLLRCPDFGPLIDELSGYRHKDKKLATDTVMALAMAINRAWDGEDIPEQGTTAIWQF